MTRADALSDGFKQTEIGLIPEEWDVARVADKYKFTAKPRGLRYDAFEAIPFVPMELVPQGKMYFTAHILKRPDEISSGTYFEPNDILIPKITPSFENGKQGIMPRLPTPFGVATTEVIPVAEISNVSSREFLFYYLLKNDVRDLLASKMDGSTGRQRLRKDLIEELRIPFPPLPEQRAIAHVLSKIQAAAEAQAAIAGRARELKRALMAKLFTEGLRGEPLKETEIGTVPEGWEVVGLDAIKANIKGAIVSGPFGSNIGKRFFVDEGVPLIRGNNLTKGDKFFVEEGFVFITEEKAEELKTCTALPNDLIFTAAGTLGQVGLIPQDCLYPKYIISNKQLRARVDEGKAVPLFLFYWFSSSIIQKLIAQRKGGVSIPVINLGILRRLPIPLPSLDEQREIAHVLQAMDAKIVSAERKQAGLEELFRAMLGELMTGQVRVKGS